RRFGRRTLREAALLELPPGRGPPQGAIVSAIVTVGEPRGPEHGFDERVWLRRKGVHVVLRVDKWRWEGRRGGLAGLADPLRDLAPGEPRASGEPCSKESCSVTTRPCRRRCETGSERRGSTTCWRCPVRTSHSWPAARSCSPG